MSCVEVGRGWARLSPKSGVWDLSPPRLHPVAVTLQRYTTQEVILQDYRIPPKVSTAAGSLLTPTASCGALSGGGTWSTGG